MFREHRYAHIALRIGLAAVFLWFGIGAFMQSGYWAETLMSERVRTAVTAVGMSPTNVVVLVGIIEVLIAASLLTGFFLRWFTSIGILFLIIFSVSGGFDERLVYHVGLISALTALLLWPERHYS